MLSGDRLRSLVGYAFVADVNVSLGTVVWQRNYAQHIADEGLKVPVCLAVPSAGACSRILPFNKVLLSPGFCRNFGSGCEPECRHFIGVLSFDDEFREDAACGGIQEKFRQAVAQGTGHHQLRGRDSEPDGAQPGAEGVPDGLREGDGEVLKQSLTDDSRLDEDVVGVQLAPDGVAVFGRRAMEVLVAAAAG